MYDIHAVTDETSGTRYAPASEEEGLLDRYTGSSITVFGTAAPEYEGGAVEGGPPLIRVSRVESAGASGEEVTVEFELTIEGEVPPNHSFYVESSAGPGGVSAPPTRTSSSRPGTRSAGDRAGRVPGVPGRQRGHRS